MIRLDKTTTKLEMVLDGASSSVKSTVFYYDVPARIKEDNSEYMGARQVVASNGTTDVTICSAPTANIVRNIDCIHIYNGDGSTKIVTIKIDEGGTEYILLVKSLTTTQSLIYNAKGGGWQTI